MQMGMIRRVAMVVALATVLAGCKAELYSGLAEREANEMSAILLSNGIDTDRTRDKDGNFTLRIERGEIPNAVALLSRSGLPRESYSSLGDVFDSNKMVSTPFEARARIMYALNSELAERLTQIAGVMSARVHVMLPESSPLDRNRSAARASVFIYQDPAIEVERHVPVIKTLIVNSVDGLNYEDVTVAIFPAEAGVTRPGVSMPGVGSIFGSLAPILIILVPILLFVGWIQLRRNDGVKTKQWLLK
ncbi:MAG: type III secretion inner membrane ring lipoprotein SctJ [Pseudomonadota bacterium]